MLVHKLYACLQVTKVCPCPRRYCAVAAMLRMRRPAQRCARADRPCSGPSATARVASAAGLFDTATSTRCCAGAFGGDMHYAQLVKLYGAVMETLQAIDRRARHRDREACAQQRLAGDIAAGRALLHRRSHDNVFDAARMDLGSRHCCLDCLTQQGGTIGVVECAAICLPDRGTRGRYDNNINRRMIPSLSSTR